MDWFFWDGILDKLSPSLEHLTIRGVRQFWPEADLDPCTLPILPRMTVLEILFSPENEDPANLSRRGLSIAELALKFAATPKSVLNYATQFPSLQRLEVGNEGVGSPFGDQLFSNEDARLESYQFVYNYFLPPFQEPCTSHHLLIIPLPLQTEEKKRTELQDRVMATFPNVKYLGRYRYY